MIKVKLNFNCPVNGGLKFISFQCEAISHAIFIIDSYLPYTADFYVSLRGTEKVYRNDEFWIFVSELETGSEYEYIETVKNFKHKKTIF